MADNLVACDVGGRITQAVGLGQHVEAGDRLLVVRSGATDVTLVAPVSGRVKSIFFGTDDVLPEAAVVAVIES